MIGILFLSTLILTPGLSVLHCKYEGATTNTEGKMTNTKYKLSAVLGGVIKYHDKGVSTVTDTSDIDYLEWLLS